MKKIPFSKNPILLMKIDPLVKVMKKKKFSKINRNQYPTYLQKKKHHR